MTTDSRQNPTGTSAAQAAVAGGADRFGLVECLAVAAVLSGAFMVVLDFFVVIVALPSIQQELGATPAMLSLVVAAYAAATAAGLVAGGRLGDIVGRKTMFLVGLGCFTAASVGCGLARSPVELVAMRVAQGLAGALLQPQVLALLGAGFSGSKRSRVFAWYAMAMGVAGVTAQVIGGLVIEADLGGLGWRGCFLVNLPIGLLGMVLAARTVQDTGRQRGLALDLVGTGLIGAALGLLVLALTYGRELGFPAWALAALATAVACALLFVWHERRLSRAGGMPLIPARLLAAPGFRLGLLAVFVFYSAVASFYFVLGLHFQQVLGLQPLASGLLFAVLGAAFFASSMFGARIAAERKTACLATGAALMALGHLWQLVAALTGPLGVPWMLPGLLLQGAGIGLVMAPLLSTVLAAAPAADAGVASGVVATVQQIGNALGVAAIAAVSTWRAAGTSLPQASGGLPLGMAYLITVCALLGLVLWAGRAHWRPRR